MISMKETNGQHYSLKTTDLRSPTLYMQFCITITIQIKI